MALRKKNIKSSTWHKFSCCITAPVRIPLAFLYFICLELERGNEDSDLTDDKCLNICCGPLEKTGHKYDVSNQIAEKIVLNFKIDPRLFYLNIGKWNPAKLFNNYSFRGPLERRIANNVFDIINENYLDIKIESLDEESINEIAIKLKDIIFDKLKEFQIKMQKLNILPEEEERLSEFFAQSISELTSPGFLEIHLDQITGEIKAKKDMETSSVALMAHQRQQQFTLEQEKIKKERGAYNAIFRGP